MEELVSSAAGTVIVVLDHLPATSLSAGVMLALRVTVSASDLQTSSSIEEMLGTPGFMLVTTTEPLFSGQADAPSLGVTVQTSSLTPPLLPLNTGLNCDLAASSVEIVTSLLVHVPSNSILLAGNVPVTVMPL